MEDGIKKLVELAATGIEIFTVIIIILASSVGTVRYLIHIFQKVPNAFSQFKERLAQMLILSLQFLVAADIIRTVILEPTMANALMLGLLVLIRTFLSWSMAVEIDGCWPWKRGKEEAEAAE